MLVDKFKLKEQLENGVVTVVFEKSSGEERTMRCTLSDMYVPQVLAEYDNQVPTPAKKQLNDDVQPVWDIDSNGWRSFHVSSVKKILTE